MGSRYFPWTGVGEDRWAAQEAVTTLYASLQLPKPRIAWAPSPKSLHVASRMLRTVQAGTAYSMVQSLVPQGPDRIEREARVALLAAMLDPDVTTQSGGLLIGSFEGVFGRPQSAPPAILQMRELLQFSEQGAPGTSSPARFMEQCMWPSLYPGLQTPRLAVLSRQAMLIMPFAKICWLCRPPVYVRLDGTGGLHCDSGPAAEWSDGFAIWYNAITQESRLLQMVEAMALTAGEES